MTIKGRLYEILAETERVKITLFCPFSRAWMVDSWFDALEKMNLPYSDFGLFIYIDNDDDRLKDKIVLRLHELITKDPRVVNVAGVRNIKVFVGKTDPLRETRGYLERRERVAAIHDTVKNYIHSPYVFGIEDDTICPPETFWKLYKDMLDDPLAGMTSGCEVGRWGFKHVGGWYFEENEKKEVVQLDSVRFQENDVKQIDAAGLYCFLAKGDLYRAHNFSDYKKHEMLGPDMAFGYAIRKKGFSVIMNCSLLCEHWHNENGAYHCVFPKDQDVVAIRFRKANQWTAELIKRSL